MSSILDLEIFVRTADSGSISAAARTLALTPAAASIALKRLETRLGIRLFARSTRSMRLTEEGRRYLESVRLALAALADGEQALKHQTQGLSGVLQLAAPSDFGRNVLLPWLDDFKRRHPNIQLQLLLNDRHSDLFRETVDAGRLVTLFDDWQGESVPFNLLCPHRVQVSERVKVLQAFLQERCHALCV